MPFSAQGFRPDQADRARSIGTAHVDMQGSISKHSRLTSSSPAKLAHRSTLPVRVVWFGFSFRFVSARCFVLFFFFLFLFTWAAAGTRCGGCRPAARGPRSAPTPLRRWTGGTAARAPPTSSSATASGSRPPPARRAGTRSSC